jgi:hypothetical protein
MSGRPLLLDSPAVAVAASDDVFVSHWCGHLTLEVFQGFATVQRSYAEARPAGYHVISLIDVKRATGIDDDAKRASEEHMRRMARSVRSSCQAILGEGFTAAAARLIIMGQHTLNPVPYPWKLVPNVPDACAWTAGQSHVPAAKIRELIDELLHPLGR